MKNYKVPFKFEGIHHCEAVVLACIDFRFWKETAAFVEEVLGIRSYDFPKLPGAAKAIIDSKDGDVASACIGVPCELHGIKKIVIVNHADCGAYGGAKKFAGDLLAEQRFHEGELRKAKEILIAKNIGKEIILVFAKLVDEGKMIEFVRI